MLYIEYTYLENVSFCNTEFLRGNHWYFPKAEFFPIRIFWKAEKWNKKALLNIYSFVLIVRTYMYFEIEITNYKWRTDTIWTDVWKDTLLTCDNWLKYPQNISIFTRQRSISVVKFHTPRNFFVNTFYFRDEIRIMIHARTKCNRSQCAFDIKLPNYFIFIIINISTDYKNIFIFTTLKIFEEKQPNVRKCKILRQNCDMIHFCVDV